MNRLESMLLGSYYYGTLPLRELRSARRSSAGEEPLMILFYHRVDDEHPNDWTMSTRDFRRQIDWLDRNFELIHFEEAQRRIVAGHNEQPAVCISFDDGYADNMKFALPMLIERGIPVTYFVTYGNIVEQKPFPHDVALGRPLQPNTLEQIRELSWAGVEIGAHTRTHRDLGQVTDEAILYDEIVTARDDLARAINHPVRYFAFPFGQPENMSREAFQLARNAGFAGVCSAFGGYNVPGRDPFHLLRIHGDPELIRVKNWLSVDRRKVRRACADGASLDWDSAVAAQGILS